MVRFRLGDNLALRLVLYREGEGTLEDTDLQEYSVSVEITDADGNVLLSVPASWDASRRMWIANIRVDDTIASARRLYVVISDASGYRESSEPVSVEVTP